MASVALAAAQVRTAGQGAGAIGLRRTRPICFATARNERQAPARPSGLNHVLAVDAEAGWVDVEGMTTYEELVACDAAARRACRRWCRS